MVIHLRRRVRDVEAAANTAVLVRAVLMGMYSAELMTTSMSAKILAIDRSVTNLFRGCGRRLDASSYTSFTGVH
jgi:hypothetical protein